jgi:hypothetical protein
MASNRLEEKLERIRKDSTVKDFAICDAKDGDMGGGIPMPGAVRGADGKPASGRPVRRISSRSATSSARTSST